MIGWPRTRVFFVGHDHTHSTPYFYSILPIFTHKLNYYELVMVPSYFQTSSMTWPADLYSPGIQPPWWCFSYLPNVGGRGTQHQLYHGISVGGEGVHNANYSAEDNLHLWSHQANYGHIKQMVIKHHDGASLVSNFHEGGGGRQHPAGSHFPRGYSSAG